MSGGGARVALTRYQDVLPAVDVEVVGSRRTFLLDTGAGMTCVAPHVAADLGLAPWGRLTGLRMGGERVDFPQVVPPRLALGGIGLAPRAVGVLDVAAFLPEGWPPVDGVLALDALQAAPFTLDLRARSLTLHGAADDPSAGAGVEVEARVGRPVQGAGCELFLRAALGERSLWLEVDSGNAAPVLLAEHAGVEVDDDGEGAEVELALAPGVTWRGEALIQDLVIDGNLGQTFLADHALTVDLVAERVWVAPSAAG